jgi:hypothetical protein
VARNLRRAGDLARGKCHLLYEGDSEARLPSRKGGLAKRKGGEVVTSHLIVQTGKALERKKTKRGTTGEWV